MEFRQHRRFGSERAAGSRSDHMHCLRHSEVIARLLRITPFTQWLEFLDGLRGQ